MFMAKLSTQLTQRNTSRLRSSGRCLYRRYLSNSSGMTPIVPELHPIHKKSAGWNRQLATLPMIVRTCTDSNAHIEYPNEASKRFFFETVAQYVECEIVQDKHTPIAEGYRPKHQSPQLETVGDVWLVLALECDEQTMPILHPESIGEILCLSGVEGVTIQTKQFTAKSAYVKESIMNAGNSTEIADSARLKGNVVSVG